MLASYENLAYFVQKDSLIQRNLSTLQTRELITSKDLKKVAVNGNGKMLAVSGNSVLVIVVPTYKQLPVTTFDVGKTRAVDLAWHPLSKTNSHLLVLLANGTLLLYNVAADPIEPEQSFHLTPPHTGVGLLNRAVSFCLGTALDWSLFTVYGLLSNGDVVSICPVLPNDFAVPATLLNRLQKQTAIDWKASPLKSQFYWRNKWLLDVLDNIHPLFPLPLAQNCYLLPQDSVMAFENANLQHIDFYDSPIGPAILLSHAMGVFVCYDLEQPGPMWALDSPTPNPSLTVFENIQLGSASHVPCTFVDPNSKAVFVGRDQDVYQIHLAHDSLKPSSIYKIVDLSLENDSTVIGLTAINDIMLGNCFVVLSQSFDFYMEAIIAPRIEGPAPDNLIDLPLVEFKNMTLEKPKTASKFKGSYPDFCQKENLVAFNQNISNTRDHVQQLYHVYANLDEQ